MDIRTCCMVACENVGPESDSNENGKLYPFPKDFNLCMLWVQNSGRPEFFEDFAFAGAQPFLSRHICSDHFDESDFIDPNDKTSGLQPGAVPNLNFILPKVEVKEEQIDPDFAETLAGTLMSENELLSEIKLEKFENDNCDELGANLSFSSTDDSCNDLLAVSFSTNTTTEIYKETKEDKELSDEFFRKYQNAMRCNKCNNRRANETDKERARRLKREALRAKIRRSQETEEQKRLRRMKNALRAAFRRRNETPEQRTLRKKKDMLRAQRRRKAETEAEARVRRYNDAVRAAFRRNNETEEQRMERKMKDIMRAAKRRSMETPEQREMRLRKDRERATRRRMLKKIAEQMTRLNNTHEPSHMEASVKVECPDNGVQPLTVPSLGSIINQCNESSSMERLQQVLEFIESKTKKSRKSKRTKVGKTADNNVHNIDLLADLNMLPCATDTSNRSEALEDGKFSGSNEHPMQYLELMDNSNASHSIPSSANKENNKSSGCNENTTQLLHLEEGDPSVTTCTIVNRNVENEDLDHCIKSETFENQTGLVQNFIGYDTHDNLEGSSDDMGAVLEPQIVWG